jgi:hypothetical protein
MTAPWSSVSLAGPGIGWLLGFFVVGGSPPAAAVVAA